MSKGIFRLYKDWADNPENVEKTEQYLTRMMGGERNVERANRWIDRNEEKVYLGLLALAVGSLVKSALKK